jgi:dTDP-4-amino-4,6-dideoxygalactose transaminase
VLIEDCAQAYAGPEYHGDPAADASLFSFGPIKAATALGGAVAMVRRETLLADMRRRQQKYPRQSRWSFLRRTVKYGAIKGLSSRLPYALLHAAWRFFGRDPDRFINGAVRNFSGADLIQQLRRLPCAPLLALLDRRLTTRRSAWLRIAELGRGLRDFLGDTIPCPGADVQPHSFWVFPVQSSDPERLILTLRKEGFDATQGQSLAVISAPLDRPDLEPHVAYNLLSQVVFLPLDPDMRAKDLQKMAAIIKQTKPEPEWSSRLHVQHVQPAGAVAKGGNAGVHAVEH